MILKEIKLSIIMLTIASLAACAPAYKVKVVQTPETQGLKGHQKPYVVNGTRYDPLRDHQGFVQEGRASWYGEQFHGRKTSNGEIYDMHAMTAAHKTLPMGVYVKVTNLDNGQQTVVRVNDRGPFVAGRIIDLSFAAASRVGVVGPGTAPVRIEALGYRADGSDAKPVYRQPESYDIGLFAVQIGAFTILSNAERLCNEMHAKHGAATINTGVVDGQTYHRVWVGHYTSLEEAERARVEFNGGFVVAIEK